MKHAFFLFLAIAVTSAVFAQQKETSYTVKGNLSDPDFQGKTIYMTRYDDSQIIDSTKIENGQFLFKGTANTPYFSRIDVGRKYYGNLILENGQITANVQESHFASGTPLNDQLKEHELSMAELYKEFDQQQSKINQSNISEDQKYEQIGKLFQEKYRPMFIQERMQVFQQHNNDPIGEIIIRSLSSEASPVEMDQVFAQAGPWLMSLNVPKKIKKQFEALKQTAEGKMFIDFEGKDENDQPLKLSAFIGKGKYTLVDFWASWCGPCREETPTIAKANELFKDKGLQVIGVATWDKPANTKKAVKELNITWPQIFDTGMKPMELYGFNGIPQIMLFGPDGTIVARNLRGEDIKKAIEKVLKP